MRRPNPVISLLTILLFCCVEPYNLQSIESSDTLVVEGFITSDLKQHQIIISRTSAIDVQNFIPETGAQVAIKTGTGTIPLSEGKPGHYFTPILKGEVGSTYQLLVTTKSGKQLISDEVLLRDNPEIEQIYATYTSDPAENEGGGSFQILLDTEDPSNTAKYFRWEFIETWQIQTLFESEFAWLGGNNVAIRTVPVSTCYPSDSSTVVITQSTVGLAESKVTAKLIQTFSGDSPKMSVRYSILIRQYSLSEKSYLFWKSLEKINQTQGSLYDVQPGTVIGNMSVVGSDETVLGYFDAYVLREKRVFFKPSDFRDAGYMPVIFGQECQFITPLQIPTSRIGTFLTQNPNLEITGATGFNDATLFLMPKQCCDCTNIGTNLKPSFWP